MNGTTSEGLSSVTNTSSGSMRGFSAIVDSSTTVEYKGLVSTGAITIGSVVMNGDSLRLVTESGGTLRGIALGCTSMTVGGVSKTVTSDFEFSVIGGTFSSTPITKPDTFEWAGSGTGLYPVYH